MNDIQYDKKQKEKDFLQFTNAGVIPGEKMGTRKSRPLIESAIFPD